MVPFPCKFSPTWFLTEFPANRSLSLQWPQLEFRNETKVQRSWECPRRWPQWAAGDHTQGCLRRKTSLLESRTHCQMEVHSGLFLGTLWGKEESGNLFTLLWNLWIFHVGDKSTEHLTNLLTPLDRTVRWHEVSSQCYSTTTTVCSQNSFH